MFFSLLVLFSVLFQVYCLSDIGDSLWKTFVHTRELPTTVEGAKDAGFKQVAPCNANLGILYAQDSSGATEDHPLSLYFTSGGQIAGVQATVFGSSDFGNSAPDQLVTLGYWKPQADNTSWAASVSFRSPDMMCSGAKDSLVVGDRAVVNQDGVALALPLSEDQAVANKYDYGSCMKDMGHHYFLDLKTAPQTSWVEENLMPVVPMFNPSTKKLHAFFFATPVKQKGSNDLLFAKHDWEAPALSPSNMCQNWCDDSCTWKTSAWSTMHIYLSSAWKGLKCPGGEGMFDRSCTV
eukprot:gene30228-36531_t